MRPNEFKSIERRRNLRQPKLVISSRHSFDMRDHEDTPISQRWDIAVAYEVLVVDQETFSGLSRSNGCRWHLSIAWLFADRALIQLCNDLRMQAGVV